MKQNSRGFGGIGVIFIIISSYFIRGLDGIRQPEQIHISYGSHITDMVVMWAVPDNVKCHVQYGEYPIGLHLTTGSKVAELKADHSRAAKFIHRSVLRNLTAETQYFYEIVCRDVQSNLTIDSGVFSFTTAPTKQTKPMKYLVYGDMGASKKIPTYKELKNHVDQRVYSAILHVGDFAYNLHSDDGKTGDTFLQNIQPFAARVPYMPSPGNHEIHGNFHHYRTRFSTPGAPWPIPLDKMWYSFDLGLVHFISYSTEVFFTNNQYYACQQFYWLLNDLIKANQNRDKTPWIIAVGHRPMYCSNADGDDCTGMFLRSWVKHGLEDLFHAQGVDLIVEAHEHSYERLWPVYDGRVTDYHYNNPRASVHVISGAAGSDEGIDMISSGQTNPWSAFRADRRSRFTYGILEVHNRTHINFRQTCATTNKTLDDFWLVQDTHGPFVANVSCSGTDDKIHKSCKCPFPFFFVTYIIIMSCVMVSIVILVSFTCFICCKRTRTTSEIKSQCHHHGFAVFCDRLVSMCNSVCNRKHYPSNRRTHLSVEDSCFEDSSDDKCALLHKVR